jgi:hypothetical protein
MDPRLKAPLACVEEGDFDAFGPLADYLEERGDPRADLARSVMTLEPPLIAQALCENRGMPAPNNGISNAGWFGFDLFASLAMIIPELGLLGLLGIAAAGGLAGSVTAIGSPTLAAALKEVEDAIRTRKLTQEMASAITFSRLVKRDHLLAQLRDTPPS